MKLKKGWSKKRYRININFEETMLLYRLGGTGESKTNTKKDIADAMYDFGYYSNSIKETDLFQFVFNEEEGERILEEMREEEKFKEIRKKIKEEMKKPSAEEVFVVYKEEKDYENQNIFEIIEVLEIFRSMKEAIDYVLKNYDVEMHFSNEEKTSFRKIKDNIFLYINIVKKTINK